LASILAEDAAGLLSWTWCGSATARRRVAGRRQTRHGEAEIVRSFDRAIQPKGTSVRWRAGGLRDCASLGSSVGLESAPSDSRLVQVMSLVGSPLV
jgi:hypothetical protein